MKLSPSVGLLVGFVLLGRPLSAHHSFAATYDSDSELEVEGSVRELVWRNPHSYLRIDVADDNGEPQIWNLEWGSINDLSTSNLTRTTLRPGDVVIASGYPPRNASSLRLLLRQLRRPSDGWQWHGEQE